MNLINVEKLAILAQCGEETAKEEIVREFTPFILNLCKKTYLNGFDFQDIQNECYASLFKALKRYNPEKHRFVAYATITIKNSLIALIKKSKRRDRTDNSSTLILTDNLEHVLQEDFEFVEDRIFKNMINLKLISALEDLEYEEQMLIEYVFIKGNTLKEFSKFIGISYSRAFKMKVRVFKKLRCALGDEREFMYMN